MYQHHEEPPSFNAARYVQVVKARRGTIVVTLLLGLLLASLLCLLTARTYTATTLVDVTPVSADPFTLVKPASTLLDPGTEQQLVKSAPVSSQVSAALGDSTTAGQVRANTTATLMTGGSVMKITYTGGSVDRARAGADAVAVAYLSYRSDRAANIQSRMIDNLQKRQEGLRKDLQNVNKTIARGAKGSAAVNFAQSERQLILIQINSTFSTASSASAVDTSGGSIISPAKASAVLASPNIKKLLLTGALVGLLLGLVLAFVRNALDSRVRDAYDVRAAGSGPVIGELSATKVSLPATADDLDELRAVRERVLARLGGARGTVAVLDRAGSKTDSDVPANLALAIAETAVPVRLLLSGFSEGYLTPLRRLELLQSSASGDDAPTQAGQVPPRRFPRFSVAALPGQTSAATLPGMLGTDSAGGGVTVLAAGRASGHAAQLSAARVADLTVVVVGSGRATKKEIRKLAAELSSLGVDGGCVVLVAKGRHVTQQRGGHDDVPDLTESQSTTKAPEASRL